MSANAIGLNLGILLCSVVGLLGLVGLLWGLLVVASDRYIEPVPDGNEERL